MTSKGNDYGLAARKKRFKHIDSKIWPAKVTYRAEHNRKCRRVRFFGSMWIHEDLQCLKVCGKPCAAFELLTQVTTSCKHGAQRHALMRWRRAGWTKTFPGQRPCIFSTFHFLHVVHHRLLKVLHSGWLTVVILTVKIWWLCGPIALMDDRFCSEWTTTGWHHFWVIWVLKVYVDLILLYRIPHHGPPGWASYAWRITTLLMSIAIAINR